MQYRNLVFSNLREKLPQEERQQVISRIKSMLFLCLYCNTKTPIATTNVEFNSTDSDAHAIAFFICPDCKNKFLLKVEDLGRVPSN